MNDVPLILPGDTVTLKSGGPVMTVASLSGLIAECIWFPTGSSDKPLLHGFALHTLVKAG